MQHSKDKQRNSSFFKAKLLDFLISQNQKKPILANEFSFGSKRQMADIICFREKSLSCFEIKSTVDNFRRINYQIEYYNKVFDYTWILIDYNKRIEAQSIVASNVGILTLDEVSEIKLVRKPKKNNTDIHEILNTMPATFLKKFFGINQKMNSYETRQFIEINFTLSEIRKSLYDFVATKYYSKTQIFFQERGSSTHTEDISIL